MNQELVIAAISTCADIAGYAEMRIRNLVSEFRKQHVAHIDRIREALKANYFPVSPVQLRPDGLILVPPAISDETSALPSPPSGTQRVFEVSLNEFIALLDTPVAEPSNPNVAQASSSVAQASSSKVEALLTLDDSRMWKAISNDLTEIFGDTDGKWCVDLFCVNKIPAFGILKLIAHWQLENYFDPSYASTQDLWLRLFVLFRSHVKPSVMQSGDDSLWDAIRDALALITRERVFPELAVSSMRTRGVPPEVVAWLINRFSFVNRLLPNSVDACQLKRALDRLRIKCEALKRPSQNSPVNQAGGS